MQTLAQSLKDKTAELHAAHMDLCRYKQMVLSLENRASLSPTHRVADVTLGNSAFDRKVVTWLVRNGMMNCASAADEEQARQAKVGARKVMSISLDLEAEAVAEAVEEAETERHEVGLGASGDAGAGAREAQPESHSEAEAEQGAEQVQEAEAEAESHLSELDAASQPPEAEALTHDDAPSTASPEANAEQTPARMADAGDGDDSSVDSGFGELGVDELPKDHVRLDENRLRIGQQTPYSDELLDDGDDHAMALIYSKPGIASSAVYISATDLYVILLQELIELKEILQDGSPVLDVHAQGGYF